MKRDKLRQCKDIHIIYLLIVIMWWHGFVSAYHIWPTVCVVRYQLCTNAINDVICFSKSQVLDKQREAKVNKYLFSRHHHVSIPSWYNAEQSGSCSFQQTRFSRHDGLHSLLEVRRRLRSGMMYIRSSGGANDYQCDKHTTHWCGECSPNQQNNRVLNKNYSCHCG